MKLKALLLDLDGTLVDTAPDMVGTLNRVLKNHSLPSAHSSDALVDEFLDDYAKNICIDSYLYDGMLEVLTLCEANQVRWGVITNKPIELSKSLLEGLGLFERCSILLGGDSLPVRKPDPAPMLHSCMVMSLAPSECLYVGDHHRDIMAGNAAGMDSAAALWGYIQDNDEPNTWKAKYLINTPQGLHRLVEDKLTDLKN